MNIKNEDRNKLCGVILAAGYGKRMKPLTSVIPKPLLPVLGKPLIDIIIKKLFRSGSSSVHINIHHLAGSFHQDRVDTEYPVTFHLEDKILDTGGGIGNMAEALNAYKLILIHNGDIISNLDFAPAVDFHIKQKALVTMILAGLKEIDNKNTPAESQASPAGSPFREPPPDVYLSEKMEVVGIGNRELNKNTSFRRGGYTGMAILSREALEFFPADRKTGLIEIILEMIKNKTGIVAGYTSSGAPVQTLWSDIGSPENYIDLHRRILSERAFFDQGIIPPGIPLHVGPDTTIASDLFWKGFLEVGAGARIERNCELENCVILPETTVQKGTNLKNCIMFPEGQIHSKG